jgi:hypothetical protein
VTYEQVNSSESPSAFRTSLIARPAAYVCQAGVLRADAAVAKHAGQHSRPLIQHLPRYWTWLKMVRT